MYRALQPETERIAIFEFFRNVQISTISPGSIVLP